MSETSISGIQRRISSIQGIYKITQAMEMVATSKLGTSKRKAAQADEYFTTIYNTLLTVFKSENFKTVFEQPANSSKTCLIVIGGDRGFAGGYNSNIFQTIKPYINDDNCHFVAIGNKVNNYLLRKDRTILFRYESPIDYFSVKDSLDFANSLIQYFLEAKFSTLSIVYTNFSSMADMTPTIIPVLPLSASEENGEDQINRILFEPSVESVIDQVVLQYIAGLVYGAVCHSVASEISSRKLAMDNSNKNAKELIDKLYIKFNRKRQEVITTEISEVTSSKKRR